MAWVSPTNVATGDVLTASKWNQDVVENSSVLYSSVKRIATVTRSTAYTVNQTALSSAADVFASDITWTADGTSAYRVEFQCASVECASGGIINVWLVNGAGTAISMISQAYTASGIIRVPGHGTTYYTPSAGSASINVRATYSLAGNGTLFSPAEDMIPIRLSLYGPDLT